MSNSYTDLKPKATERIPYTLYYGTFIHTPYLDNLQVHFNTLVGVNSEGVIDFIHTNYDRSSVPVLDFFKTESSKRGINYSRDCFKFVDCSNNSTKFFVPGFIDTHIHASQYPNIGVGLDCPLLDWLNTHTFPLENEFTKSKGKQSSFARDVYSKVIKKTLENGTTCASYFTTIDTETTNLFAELLLKFGQRGFVGKVCMDHNETYPDYEETYDECVESMNKIIKHLDHINPSDEVLVKPIITPRFAPVCSRDLLKYLGRLSNELNLPIQTHISENKKEVELVKILFPDCENYASVYNKHNLLNKSTILAHAIHLTEKERSIIKSKGCSISHCPTSNTFISSGEAPIKKYLYQDKINVSLGTDVSGGFESSILGIIKHSILVSHHLSMNTKSENKLTLSDAIYMATQGGAKAVGLENVIGSFEIGKKFDVQLIDLESIDSNIDVFDWQLPYKDESNEVKQKKMFNLLGKWIFSGDNRNCVKIWCNGRLVVDKIEQEREKWVFVESISID